MQPDEDPFALLQIRRRADAYEFGVRACPFLEGAQRSSDRVATGARQPFEVSLPGGRKSNVGRGAHRFARDRHSTGLEGQRQGRVHGQVAVERRQARRGRTGPAARVRLSPRAPRPTPSSEPGSAITPTYSGSDLVSFILPRAEELEAPVGDGVPVPPHATQERRHSDQPGAIIDQGRRNLSPLVRPKTRHHASSHSGDCVGRFDTLREAGRPSLPRLPPARGSR